MSRLSGDEKSQLIGQFLHLLKELEREEVVGKEVTFNDADKEEKFKNSGSKVGV